MRLTRGVLPRFTRFTPSVAFSTSTGTYPHDCDVIGFEADVTLVSGRLVVGERVGRCVGGVDDHGWLAARDQVADRQVLCDWLK